MASLLVGLWLLAPALLAAQYQDDSDTPLGDVARNFRKQNAASLQASPRTSPPAAQPEIIDNDNLSQVMDEVDSRRVARSSFLYSIEGPGKSFQVASPDVTCSLSFTANVKSLLASSYTQMELPADALVKLSGPAAIHGDSLQVSVFNGTDWHVSEVGVVLTVVKRTEFPEEALGDRLPGDASGNKHRPNDNLAKVVPAAGLEPFSERDNAAENHSEKRSDIAVLYHMRAAAPPFGVTVFAAPLNMEIAPDQEWHWAIVQAKGYPPRQNAADPSARSEESSSPRAEMAVPVASAAPPQANPASVSSSGVPTRAQSAYLQSGSGVPAR
ncbi:MAG TPA: hypothetical protein VIW68_01855 [Candidatus Sulfotelmatobacter sp.]